MPAGLCFTEAEDEILAHGWPNQARLEDEHPHDRSPSKSALSYVSAIDPKYFSVWPREVAHRVLRAGPIVQFAKTEYANQALTKKTVAALEATGPMSSTETKEAVSQCVASLDEHTYEFKVKDFIYLAETLIGADETLDAIATGFELSKPQTTRTGGTPAESYVKTYTAGTIGFLLLRASPKARAKLVQRLEAQHARFADIAKKHDDWAWCAEHFDMSLHGVAGVKRMMTGRVNLDWVEYAHDDPDFVRACVVKEPKQSMSVRIVHLGGLETMKGLLKRKISAPEQPAALRDFGMIRAPESVDLVLSLVGKTSVKDAPLKWLIKHADYARPIVERSAKAGGASAKAVLAQMPK